MSVAGTLATSAASSAAASQNQKNVNKSAADATAASDAQTDAAYSNQLATLKYQDQTWQQDLDYASQTLGYDKTEFAKQGTYVASADTAVGTNENTSLAQTMLRSVQQDISTTFNEANTNSSAAKARASAQVGADTNGVSGASVNQIIQAVTRQQGEANDVMEMNRSAQHQQAYMDLQGVAASSNSQLESIQSNVRTFAPSTPIRAPAAVPSVQDATVTTAADVSSAQTSPLAIAGGVAQAAVSGFNTYNSISGQTANKTLTQLGSALGIN